jgi:hypothetical protein
MRRGSEGADTDQMQWNGRPSRCISKTMHQYTCTAGLQCATSSGGVVQVVRYHTCALMRPLCAILLRKGFLGPTYPGHACAAIQRNLSAVPRCGLPSDTAGIRAQPRECQRTTQHNDDEMSFAHNAQCRPCRPSFSPVRLMACVSPLLRSLTFSLPSAISRPLPPSSVRPPAVRQTNRQRQTRRQQRWNRHTRSRVHALAHPTTHSLPM